uniref:WD_REPEATS_REGION domain-containing protein n=1 Tax=Heterorhabditis bacteriophora TaxID=37862 RepID=A0A1I7XE85_HETBA
MAYFGKQLHFILSPTLSHFGDCENSRVIDISKPNIIAEDHFNYPYVASKTVYEHHKHPIYACSFNPYLPSRSTPILATAAKNTISIYKCPLETNDIFLTRTFKDASHLMDIFTLAWCYDISDKAHRLAVGGYSGLIRLIDPNTGARIQVLSLVSGSDQTIVIFRFGDFGDDLSSMSPKLQVDTSAVQLERMDLPFSEIWFIKCDIDPLNRERLIICISLHDYIYICRFKVRCYIVFIVYIYVYIYILTVRSPGWIHYMIHGPERHVLLFRRPLSLSQPITNNKQNNAQQSVKTYLSVQLVCVHAA